MKLRLHLHLHCILLLSVLIVFLVPLLTVASPANPNPITLLQPDGGKIRAITVGDEWYHYTKTIDGYSILKDGDGWWVYAKKDVKGDLISTGVRVSPKSLRSQSEEMFIESLGKHLKDSKEKIKSMEMLNPNSLENFHKGRVFNMKKWKKSKTKKFINEPLMIDAPANDPFKIAVILIEFEDLEHNPNHTVQSFEGLWNDMAAYYREVSYGNFHIDADVYGWYLADHPSNYYSHSHANRWTRYATLVKDAIAKADGDINFSTYDNDGNGEVEGIVIIHSGQGAAEANQTQYIWAHKNDLALAERKDLVNIRTYCMFEEIQHNRLTGIGIMAHEYSHVLGLPDLYDTDNSSSGIGNWGLMGSGNWLNQGRTPSHLSPWSKMQLDWLDPILIRENDAYSIINSVRVNAQQNPEIYRVNTVRDGEYFLIENKQQSGWDASLPGHGLMIWHIDDNIGNNNNENHKKVDIEEADNENHLDNRVNRGDAGDTYPGTSVNRSFDVNSLPNSNLYDARESGIAVTNISDSSNNMSFDIVVPPVQYPDINGSTQYEWIDRVQIGPLNNQSGNNNGYGDFTANITLVQRGQNLNVTLTPGFTGGNSYSEHWKIWLDANGDGDFEDPGEELFTGNGTAAINGNIIIPANATVGTTRLRIAMRYNNPPPHSGNIAGGGEAEDYTFDIQ